eukprot:gnl/Ergobibamus_cyprinoides/1571.p1 GENE.gnl/Ergobibamus_cyprinoides/1571~~gnl/Ergobibamus_cyprinoides/1571.p1  ORF type:complete len:280 (-),score=86.93 gnl/Ergobibamus_cyprinoides/1571:32-829(-)
MILSVGCIVAALFLFSPLSPSSSATVYEAYLASTPAYLTAMTEELNNLSASLGAASTMMQLPVRTADAPGALSIAASFLASFTEITDSLHDTLSSNLPMFLPSVVEAFTVDSVVAQGGASLAAIEEARTRVLTLHQTLSAYVLAQQGLAAPVHRAPAAAVTVSGTFVTASAADAAGNVLAVVPIPTNEQIAAAELGTHTFDPLDFAPRMATIMSDRYTVQLPSTVTAAIFTSVEITTPGAAYAVTYDIPADGNLNLQLVASLGEN